MWVKLLSGYEGKNKNSNIRINSYSFWKRSKLGVYRALGTNQRYATVQKFREIYKINCAFKTKLQDLTELWFWNFSRLICSQVKLSIHALQMPFFKTHNPHLFQLNTGSPQPVPQQKETHDPPKPWPNVTPPNTSVPSDLDIWTFHPKVEFCLQTKNNRNLPSLNIFSLCSSRGPHQSVLGESHKLEEHSRHHLSNQFTPSFWESHHKLTKRMHSRLVNNSHFRSCPACHSGRCISLLVEERVMQFF